MTQSKQKPVAVLVLNDAVALTNAELATPLLALRVVWPYWAYQAPISCASLLSRFFTCKKALGPMSVLDVPEHMLSAGWSAAVRHSLNRKDVLIIHAAPL